MSGWGFLVLVASGAIGLGVTVVLASRFLVSSQHHEHAALLEKDPSMRQTMILHSVLLFTSLIAWPVLCVIWLTDQITSGELIYWLIFGLLALIQLIRAGFEWFGGLSVTVNPGRRTVTFPDLTAQEQPLKRLYQVGDEVVSAGQWRFVGTVLTLLLGTIIMWVAG